MKATVHALLASLLLFCFIQILALYVWLPRNKLRRSNAMQYLDSWENIYLSRGDLQQGFVLLSHLGKRNGLSDKELMVMLMQGLTGSESVVKTKGQLQIQGNMTSPIEDIHKAKERSLHSGDVSSGKRGFVTESGNAFLPPLTNISDGERKKAKLNREVTGAVPAMNRPEVKAENHGVTVRVNNSITKFRLADVNKTSNEHSQVDLSVHNPESYKWYMSTKGSNPVNPHTYNLIINQPNICRPQLDVFLLIVMISTPGNVGQRDMLRNTTLSATNVSGKQIRYVFLLGESSSPMVTALIHEEAAKYGDILMEDFRDSYRNLTLKTLMGLKWASFFCPQAKYVLKTDDDVYISFTNLIRLLVNAPRERYMTGYVYNETKPYRTIRSKWYLSKEDFPRDIFPPYCCGIGYIMSGDLTSMIYEVSLSLPYLFLEDVFVGICMEKLNVTLTGNPGFLEQRQAYEYCKFKEAYIIHLQLYFNIGKYWVHQKTNPKYVTC